MKKRTAKLERKTLETEIKVALNLDGEGKAEISTGIGFLDHLFSTLAFHSRFDLKLTCAGDLKVDDHHTAEDCAIALGKAIDLALGERIGIARFGYAYAPLDEALARAVVDLSGRPFADINLSLGRESLGALNCENIPHILRSFAASALITLHLEILKGENDHHKAEAAFKALALALKQSFKPEREESIASTKGMLK
ncbi:MAG: imidazoleglycerol-phosphate dehydratase HisB [Myxococcota bacterium]